MNLRASSILSAAGVALVLGASSIPAATPPERINFQGVLRDASGAPVPDGDYNMLFRFFGDGAGACDCGQAHGTGGCSETTCQTEVCALDPYCCDGTWDGYCAAEADRFGSCQSCIADEEALVEDHNGPVRVTVTGGLFHVALGGFPIDGSGPGTHTSLGEVFRDYGVVYVETEVNAEVLAPRIRVESSAFTQNALQLEGKRAAEFLDTSAAAQTKAGDLDVQGDVNLSGPVTLGGDVTFADGSVLRSARPDPPCFDTANRFVDCGNGTITDTETGLVWLKDANCNTLVETTGDTGIYPEANDAAASLQHGACGLTDHSSPGDWRLPTVAELQAIVEQAIANGCSDPLLPDASGLGCWTSGDPFTGALSLPYWSSTSGSPTAAQATNLFSGTSSLVLKTGYARILPVRGGS